jgi:hypothetical protein
VFSDICPRSHFLLNEIMVLKMCLKIRQVGEGGRIQGKFRLRQSFPTELSTETGDTFPLAPAALSLQRRWGIDVSGTEHLRR